MKPKFHILYLWLYLFMNSITVFGQSDLYKGGSGRGDISGSTGNVFLSGIQYFVTHSGGFGRGDASFRTSLLSMNGSVYQFVFAGGTGRGDKKDASPFSFLNGDEVDLKYRGGSGDGSDLANPSTPIYLNGTIYVTIYAGGIGSGTDFGLGNGSLLNGSAYTLNYPGGIGSGASSLKGGQILLNGTQYVVVYAGGIGRGDANKKSNSIKLNGAASMVFARVAEQPGLDFEILETEKGTVLNWSTETSDLTRSFEIENSDNGMDFHKIGSIMPFENERNRFSFRVPEMQAGTHHLRLKQIYEDYSFQFSATKKLNMITTKNWVHVYPNPASSFLHIDRSTIYESVQISVYDLSGKSLSSTVVDPNMQVRLDIQSLQKGIYWLMINSGSLNERVKFIKD